MKKLITSLFLLLTITCNPINIQSDLALENAVAKLVSELTIKYSNKYKVHFAVLQFRTEDDKVSRFNHVIQNEIIAALRDISNIMVIEQYSGNHLLEEQGWSLANFPSFKVYSSLNESLFKSTGIIADVFVYGVVRVDGDNISITGYLLPDGIASNAIKSTVQVPIKDLPNNLLVD
ncbi:MAG: hypothetical protein F9K37_00210 [Bacteroidales bacterium]|nr:MAG: hypothetical protein F9K37_00210 [Bacteroidales bacterium]